MDHMQRVRQEFTRQADRFAASPAIAADDLTRRLVAALGAHTGAHILDVACGPGIVTAALATTALTVVALDLTPAMLAKARQRCDGLENVTFQEGSATDMPFRANSFDAVVTRLSIHHFAQPRRALDEMFRVVRPGGRMLIADVVSSEVAEKSKLQNAIEILRDPSHVRMLPATELAAVVSGAGFAIERQESWDKPRAFDEWADIVDDPARIAPLRVIAGALARAGEDAGMGLSRSGDTITFFHRWHLIFSRKPLGESS